MKVLVVVKALALLATFGSLSSMAATITITPSTTTVNVGDTFSLTISANVPNTFAATMALSFNPAVVSYVSGTALAPWNVFVKNSPASATPTVFDVEAPFAMTANPGVYNVAQLTFQLIAAGNPNIIINDDGGAATGWFDADTAEYIPNTYTQASYVPVPPTLWLLGTGLLGLLARRPRQSRRLTHMGDAAKHIRR